MSTAICYIPEPLCSSGVVLPVEAERAETRRTSLDSLRPAAKASFGCAWLDTFHESQVKDSFQQNLQASSGVAQRGCPISGPWESLHDFRPGERGAMWCGGMSHACKTAARPGVCESVRERERESVSGTL